MEKYDYFELKHDYAIEHDLSSDPASVAIHNFQESGPYFEKDIMLAVKLSLALAKLEVEKMGYLQNITNHMFVKTFDFVSYLDEEEHPVTKEEIEEMLKDVKYILDSGKVRFKDVPIEEGDITNEEYLEYMKNSDK